MKRKLLTVILLAATGIGLLACSKEETSDIVIDYQYDYLHHYSYNENGDVVHDEPHTYNSDHKCSVCGYQDEIFLIDQDGALLGLTEEGKKLNMLILPNDVSFIDDKAFKDSCVEDIFLPNSVIGIGPEAYQFISNITCKKETSSVEYVQFEEDDVYFKKGLFSEDDECYIGNKPYKTLDEALEDVNDNNTTINIVKEEVTLSKMHNVSLEVRLAPRQSIFASDVTITGDINVLVSGVLEIANGVTFEGNVNLQVRTVTSNYTSGAVAFEDCETKPASSTVKYYGDIVTPGDDIARGGKVVRNKVLIIPVNYFAFGILEFNKDFNVVTSLSPYGRTLSSITITSPLISKDAEIESQAFTQKYHKVIQFIKKFVDVTLWIVEGVFQHVTIGDGITKVGSEAFQQYIHADVTKVTENIARIVSAIMCHIRSVYIGDSCTSIEYGAFDNSANLETINGSAASLKHIHENAFNHSRNLKSVNISGATKLENIDKAFQDCPLLTRFVLPTSNGWKIDGRTYLYEDLTTEAVARHIASSRVITKDNSLDNLKYVCYNPNDLDEFKIQRDIRYYDTFQNALNAINDGETLKILEGCDFSGTTFTCNKKITIDATSQIEGRVPLKCNFVVSKDAYIIFKNKVQFTGNITLNNKDADNLHNTAGVAFENIGFEKTSGGATVKYEHFEAKNILGVTSYINDSSYTCYGLYNEDVDFYGGHELITSLSPLGNIMTRMVLSSQFAGAGVLKIGENSFKGNKTLRDVYLTEDVTIIYKSAFEDSDITSIHVDRYCRSIGEAAFKNTKNLKEFDFSKVNNFYSIGRNTFLGSGIENVMAPTSVGWKFNKVAISPNLISDSVKFANMLKGSYANGEWTLND